ncbi:MAG: molybdopterin-dependent oxidoreductase, partial [Paracoccaceae bacterium]
REPKRATEDLDLGPLVETHMTRCISCTRCVRFTTEVAGIHQMGQTGRGEDSEITSYLQQTLTSELQGNVVDLCPVGALTSKPYAFTARPWELRKTESIDVIDALGSNIRIDVRGREVMRILPRNHDGVNEEWLSDRSRYVWDGLRRQRLDRPYLRKGGKLTPVSWDEALTAAAEAMKGGRVGALAGDLAPVEAMFSLKSLVDGLGGVCEGRQDGARLPVGNRAGYAGTARIEDLESADRVLIVGAAPRLEAPVLNARIRKGWLAGAEIGVVGEAMDLTYEHQRFGAGPDTLQGVGRAALRGFLEEGENRIVVLGQGALARPDGAAVLGHVMEIVEAAGAKLLVLHTAAARVGALDVGFANPGGLDAVLACDTIYALGADEVEIPDGPFVIYQGSHGDRGAHRADLILPGAAWPEEQGMFVNTEGRPQLAVRAAFPPGEARENWAILRALSAKLDAVQPWNDLGGLRMKLFEAAPWLARIDDVPENAWRVEPSGDVRDAPFRSTVADHYLVNPICRASTVMAELSRRKAEREADALAAE